MCPQLDSEPSNPLQYSVQLILYGTVLGTASIQVILPCTILAELLGGTGERGHGWAA